ncbi:hypothetical protein MATL_G00000610 [Megalops atlanticus]|uniref:ATP synthase subunit f, mitochondrial n=1 Tax=Megalops atlanticus TaxID=7932 RepID=A0A9D3QFB3_MEGAT|nr:hypothetical protein MATL_G00000610 [Megalops atlanticus]
MSPDERSERAQTEVCPFCGRPFKRLKSHIAHCKMAPVSKTSKPPDTIPPEKSAVKTAVKKKKKVMAKQFGLSDANLADIQSGPALKTKNTDPKEKTVAVKVSQNKKTSKTLDSPAVSAMKVKAKILKNTGPETVQPTREQESGGKQRLVRGTVLVPSKPGGKSSVSVFPSMEANSAYTAAEKGPVPAASGIALPGSKWSPTKGPLSWNLPKDKAKRSAVRSVPSPTGGAVAQASLGGSSTDRVKAEEGSLQSQPRTKVNLWDNYSSWASVNTLGEDRQRPQRSEKGYSVEHPWTKTSVWDHIKEGMSCRSPGLLLSVDCSEEVLKGSLVLAPHNANPQDQVPVESGYHLATGVSSECLTEIHALHGRLQLPPQANTHTFQDSHVELSRTLDTLCENQQQSQRSEEGYSVGHPWTKTSVWDHIKEGWSCRSPGLLLAVDRSEGVTQGSSTLGLHNEVPVESRCQSGVGVSSERLTESLALHGLLQLPPQAHTRASGDSDMELSRTMQRARGLEGTMELAAGYRGIGLSMFPLHPSLLPLRLSLLPLRLSTEHVQTKAPPIQRPATGSQGPLTERRLMDMTLSELPAWLTSRRLLTPREAVAAVQRGWLWYYRKYIDVRKGGIGGIGMLLAGYCVLSYVWNYPHLKHDRWRKYH